MTSERNPRPGAEWVVGVDGSPNATRALRWAAYHAPGRTATLRVVRAWSAPITGGLAMPTWNVDDFRPGRDRRIGGEAHHRTRIARCRGRGGHRVRSRVVGAARRLRRRRAARVGHPRARRLLPLARRIDQPSVCDARTGAGRRRPGGDRRRWRRRAHRGRDGRLRRSSCRPGVGTWISPLPMMWSGWWALGPTDSVPTWRTVPSRHSEHLPIFTPPSTTSSPPPARRDAPCGNSSRATPQKRCSTQRPTPTSWSSANAAGAGFERRCSDRSRPRCSTVASGPSSSSRPATDGAATTSTSTARAA